MNKNKNTMNTNTVKVINGYRLANPIMLMLANSKGNWIVNDTPYGFHFDLPVLNGLEAAMNTVTAKLFKRYGEMFTKQNEKFFKRNVHTEFYAYAVDGVYIRFEMLTSDESITDAMEAAMPAFQMEHHRAAFAYENGREMTDEEWFDFANKTQMMVHENLKKIVAYKGGY